MITAFIRRMGKRIPPDVVRHLVNLWRPYWGAGVVIERIDPDYRYVKVGLKLKWWNRNYVGTQFGGSLYAMTDPFFMLMFINNLGPDYIVWDKGATIDFVSPGRTRCTAEFRITQAQIDEVRARTAGGDKYVFDLPAEVRDASGEVVATVLKKIYVRKKRDA